MRLMSTRLFAILISAASVLSFESNAHDIRLADDLFVKDDIEECYLPQLQDKIAFLKDCVFESAETAKESYYTAIGMYQKYCGFAKKNANEIIGDVASRNNEDVTQKLIHLCIYDSATNSNNSETLVYIWHLKEILSQDHEQNLTSLINFLDAINPVDQTEFAIHLIQHFIALLGEALQYNAQLAHDALCFKNDLINDLDVITKNEFNLTDNIDFVRTHYHFLNKNHSTSFTCNPINFDIAKYSINAQAPQSVFDMFDVIEAYDVPGYNIATNTNTKETFVYVYGLCSLKQDFRPLIDALKKSEGKSVDELACRLVNAWVYLQYHHLTLKTSAIIKELQDIRTLDDYASEIAELIRANSIDDAVRIFKNISAIDESVVPQLMGNIQQILNDWSLMGQFMAAYSKPEIIPALSFAPPPPPPPALISQGGQARPTRAAPRTIEQMLGANVPAGGRIMDMSEMFEAIKARQLLNGNSAIEENPEIGGYRQRIEDLKQEFRTTFDEANVRPDVFKLRLNQEKGTIQNFCDNYRGRYSILIGAVNLSNDDTTFKELYETAQLKLVALKQLSNDCD